MKAEYVLKWLLRAGGGITLLALVFVGAPDSWFADAHERMGLGELPGDPVVGYLARSLSAFYALHGAMLLVMSSDVRRYRPLLIFFGWAMLCFGIALIGIDTWEQLPMWWILGEGPWVALFGGIVLILARRVDGPAVT